MMRSFRRCCQKTAINAPDTVQWNKSKAKQANMSCVLDGSMRGYSHTKVPATATGTLSNQQINTGKEQYPTQNATVRNSRE